MRAGKPDHGCELHRAAITEAPEEYMQGEMRQAVQARQSSQRGPCLPVRLAGQILSHNCMVTAQGFEFLHYLNDLSFLSRPGASKLK